MPYSLRIQLTLQMHRRLFTEVPLFRRTDARIVCLMIQEMKPMIALPNEMIMHEGCAAKGLFIILKGTCVVLQSKHRTKRDEHPVSERESVQMIAGDQQHIRTLFEGEFFGEISLLEEKASSASVRAAEYTSLMVLLVDQFQYFCARFPQLKEEMSKCREAQSERYQRMLDTRVRASVKHRLAAARRRLSVSANGGDSGGAKGKGKGGGKARFSTAFTSDRRTHPTTRAADEPSAAPSIPERPDE